MDNRTHNNPKQVLEAQVALVIRVRELQKELAEWENAYKDVKPYRRQVIGEIIDTYQEKLSAYEVVLSDIAGQYPTPIKVSHNTLPALLERLKEEQ